MLRKKTNKVITLIFTSKSSIWAVSKEHVKDKRFGENAHEVSCQELDS